MTMQTWQQQLRTAITDPKELCELLALNQALIDDLAVKSFAVKVPLPFLARMQKGDPNDPLLRQVLATQAETLITPGYTEDALQEKNVNPIPGLLHKYQSRVLLTLAGGCAINCRYCFRRHFPYQDNLPNQKNWQLALDYISHDKNINEVIFSGGDPLILKDHLLKNLTEKIEKIKHVNTLRIHTRLPIVIPARINNEFIAWLTSTRLKPVIVLHCNHPNEIDDAVIQALKKCRDKNITLLNQAVLLKNINDNADALIALSYKLFDAGVLPYYLHILDKVQGTAHFDIEKQKALQLHRELQANLPGYLVPKLATEVPGEQSKKLI